MSQYCVELPISKNFGNKFGNNNTSYSYSPYSSSRDRQRSGDKLAVTSCAAEYRSNTYSHYSSTYTKNCSGGNCTTPSTTYTSANQFWNGKA